jgi:hypothetical protein
MRGGDEKHTPVAEHMPSIRDDWGLEPLDAHARHNLLEILEDR